MAKRTKKVKGTGKFGPRYGVKARTKYRKVDEKQRRPHVCPRCGHQRVKRESTAIWVCSKCGAKMAGGAYQLQTDAGLEVKKSLRSVVAEDDS
jgi:large subunit ribosomal protein L37Ae